jgi:hypothetical protein
MIAWQDAVLSAGNIFFCFKLISDAPPSCQAAATDIIPTRLALLVGRFVFATLHLCGSPR